MLARAHRLHRSHDFREVVRHGARAGSRSVVVHLLSRPSGVPGDMYGDEARDEPDVPPQIGFVVSRSVGAAVQRNLVKRRLRHLSRDLLPLLAPGTRIVVRALPAAATTPVPDLAEDLRRCLHRVTRVDGPAASPR